MYMPDGINRGGSQNAEGVYGCSLWADPPVPNTCKAENVLLGGYNAHRLLAAVNLEPFIVSVCRNQAPALVKGFLKSRFLMNSFHPGIDKLITYRHVFGPERNKTPAHHHHLPLAFGFNDYRQRLGRRSIINWLKFKSRTLVAKTPGNAVRIHGDGITAAHADFTSLALL